MNIRKMTFLVGLVSLAFAQGAYAQGALGAAVVAKTVEKLGTDVAVPIANSLTGGVTSGGSVKNHVEVKGDVISVAGDNSELKTNVGAIRGVTAKKDIENKTIVSGKVVNAVGNNSKSELRVGGIGN